MPVKKIHVIFKTHLDIGYTDFAAKVKANYIENYIPASINVARTLRESGSKFRFVWQTGSWLIYEYLHTVSAQKRADFEKAISDGDIYWHGLPCTSYSELMNLDLFHYGLSLSGELDKRFSRKTIAAKLTDVAGHTKAIIKPMTEHGIQFLHIGVNPAVTAPSVPPLFNWVDDSGNSLTVMYNNGYGQFSPIEGTDCALYFAHTNDNMGPQTAQGVIEEMEALEEKYPDAEIIASNLSDAALDILKIKSTLPTITDEIGDTWIHGAASDPRKISGYRALLRKCENLDGQTQKDAYSHLILIAEHTWGGDEKVFLADNTDYKRSAFEKKLRTEKYKTFEQTWQEQRDYINDAAKAMGQSAETLLEEYKRKPAPFGTTVSDKRNITIGDYRLSVNDAGEIDRLAYRGNLIADEKHRLCSFFYEQFCKADYDRFYSQYVTQDLWWTRDDLTKVNMEDGCSEHLKFVPLLDKVSVLPGALCVRMNMPPQAHELYGCPQFIDYIVTFDERKLTIDFAWFNKPKNRVAEASWLAFHPIVQPEAWRISKLSQQINPYKVITNGNNKLHATDIGVYNGSLSIESLDCAVVAPGKPSLLNFNNDPVDTSYGMSFNLHNNIWGTNHPMWYGEDARFRFVINF